MYNEEDNELELTVGCKSLTLYYIGNNDYRLILRNSEGRAKGQSMEISYSQVKKLSKFFKQAKKTKPRKKLRISYEYSKKMYCLEY